jgi:segregation and condensation protein A
VAREQGQAFHPRSVALEDPYASLLPDLELKVSTSDLVAAALRVLTPKPQRELDVSHVSPIKASVRDAIIEMTEFLIRHRSVSFVELCGGARARIDVVVRFLGLLEMFKAGAIELSQHDRFGSIQARWTGDAEATEILEDVEEYTFQEEGA